MGRDIQLSKWNESYLRCENALLFPQEEIVRFLNTFVRKKFGPEQFENIIDSPGAIRCLDYGCGIGRQTILMSEFGLEAHGVDISDRAIAKAQSLSFQMNVGDPRPTFTVVDGVSIPFCDRCFDVSICAGVADSMRFDLARRIVRELDRVTKSLAFMTLISDLGGARPSEEVVETNHERGTIQSYYSEDKINELLKVTAFELVSSVHVLRSNTSSGERYGRWSLVVSKM